MAGGPSHLETFDYKPKLAEMNGQPMPESFTKGQPIAQLQGSQAQLLRAAVPVQEISANRDRKSADIFPNIGKVADDICIIRSMHTEAINHDPAHTFMNTGTTISGRPSMGSWAAYGLGSDCDDLPGFVVLTSTGRGGQTQPIAARQWTAAFCRAGSRASSSARKGDPVLYVGNPAGVTPAGSATWSTPSTALNRLRNDVGGRPGDRHAHRPVRDGLQDADERAGPDGPVEGAARRSSTCTARRAATARSPPTACWPGGWPSAACASSSSTTATGTITAASRRTSRSRPRRSTRRTAALINDLKQRGMLDDTLVIWGGEFGRTPMAQGDGRDHHIKGFSIWLAGGGIKGGITYGATDEFGYNAVENPVHVHDLHATMLHLLGIDHARLTYRYQGRDFRLTDVAGKVVKGILA